jgi:hypothetical protein
MVKFSRGVLLCSAGAATATAALLLWRRKKEEEEEEEEEEDEDNKTIISTRGERMSMLPYIKYVIVGCVLYSRTYYY